MKELPLARSTFYDIKLKIKETVSLYENKGNHKNPEQGLVVLDQITNYKKFEFYIQPQEVTIGSATPTYFHVPYGNMNFPEILFN